MDDAAERYLEELRRNLRPLPKADRSEAVREIESHIAEGRAHGRPTEAVLAGLGDARSLARAYVADYHLRVPRDGALGSAARLVLSSVFVSGTGLLSLFVVPLLALLTSLAGLLAVASPVLGVLEDPRGVWDRDGRHRGLAGADHVELPGVPSARRSLHRPGMGGVHGAARLPAAGIGWLPQALADARCSPVGSNADHRALSWA
jgi:Protein of unknown function (DUF1700)